MARVGTRARNFESLRRVLREFAGDVPQGVAERLTAAIGQALVQTTPRQAGDVYLQQALSAGLIPRIIEGLDVVATDPVGDSVKVFPGSGYCAGNLYKLSRQAQLQIPLTDETAQQVFYVVLVGDEDLKVVRSRDRANHILLAQIMAPYTDVQRVVNSRPINPNDHDAYIISGKDFLLATGLEIDEISEDAIKEIVQKLRADALFGTLTVSDQLIVQSADGTIKITDAVRIFNADGVRRAEFSKEGIFFWDDNRRPLARFTGREGASMIAGLDVYSDHLLITPGATVETEEGGVVLDEKAGGLIRGDGGALEFSGGAVRPTHSLHVVTIPTSVTSVLRWIRNDYSVDGDWLLLAVNSGAPAGTLQIQHTVGDEGVQIRGQLAATYDVVAGTGTFMLFVRSNDEWVFMEALSSQGALKTQLVTHVANLAWTGDGTNNRLIPVIDNIFGTAFSPDLALVVLDEAFRDIDRHLDLAWSISTAYGYIFTLPSDVANTSGETGVQSAGFTGVVGTDLKLSASGGRADGTNFGGYDYKAIAIKFGA